MKYKNILNINNRYDFREWLKLNHDKEKECYLVLKRGKPLDNNKFYYLDAIEEALCFGWIDSTLRNIDGIAYQRFTSRSKNSNWTELNKQRVRRLIELGLMDESGLKVLPNMSIRSFKPDIEIINELKKNRVYSKFRKFPKLYQRIRLSNLMFYKDRLPNEYKKVLKHTIESTKQGKTFGEWNDYGRLKDE